MDPNFQSRYLEGGEKTADEAADPLAEPQAPPAPGVDEPTTAVEAAGPAEPAEDPLAYMHRPVAPQAVETASAMTEIVHVSPPPRQRPAAAAPPRAAPPHANAHPGQRAWPDGPATARPQPPAVMEPQQHWAPSPAGGSAHTSTFQPGSSLLRVEDAGEESKPPPEMGWRKGIYVGSGKLINLGAGPAELALRANIAAITANIPGNYTIAVLSVGGGVGKTRTTAALGTTYASYRTEPVIALDAHPTYGKLGRFIDPAATATVRDFMADDRITTYPMARSYTGKNKQGLEVLAGNQNVGNPLALSAEVFDAVIHRARRFYQLALIDCGPDIEHWVMRSVLARADALVVVGTMGYDGAAAAETTLDWLDARNSHDLLRRSAVVLNDLHGNADDEFVSTVEKSLGPRVGAVKTIPFDPHLRDARTLDATKLAKRTKLAYIDVAAWLAKGFSGAVGAR